MARRKTDDFSPMDEARPDGGWCDEGSGDQEGFLQQRQASPSASRPLHDVSKTTWHPEAVSPGTPSAFLKARLNPQVLHSKKSAELLKHLLCYKGKFSYK